MTDTTTTEPQAPPNGAVPDRPMPTNVIAALARVMEELPAIGKDQRSEQGYNYRGIEDITAKAQKLLGRYGVVFVPKVLKRRTLDLTINNKPWTQEELKVVYTVYGPGGVSDCITVGPIWGLGRDNSDKGSNKSLTQTFKYALLQALCVADPKDDADRDVAHEADAHGQQRGQAKAKRPPPVAPPPPPGFVSHDEAAAEHKAVQDRNRALPDDVKEAIREHVKAKGWPMAKADLAVMAMLVAEAEAKVAGIIPTPDDSPPPTVPNLPALTDQAAGAILAKADPEVVQAISDEAKAMKGDEVDAELREAGQPTAGKVDERRLRWVALQVLGYEPPDPAEGGNPPSQAPEAAPAVPTGQSGDSEGESVHRQATGAWEQEAMI